MDEYDNSTISGDRTATEAHRPGPPRSRARWWVGAGIVAAAILVLGGIASVASESETNPDGTDLAVFTAAEAGLMTWFDLGNPNDDPSTREVGDLRLDHKPLVDPDSGEEVGRVVTRVQVVDAGGGDPFQILDCTVELDGGKLVFYGSFRGSESAGPGAVFPLMGGTGRYSGAEGTVTARMDELDDGTKGVRIAFDLIGS